MLIIGATNRPFDLDEAALRRLTKRIYIELPDGDARIGCIIKMISQVKYHLSNADKKTLAKLTEGYSFADLSAVTKDAAMGPIRNAGNILNLDKS